MDLLRVMVADDHALYRAGLTLLLKQEGIIADILEADSLDGALAGLTNIHCDVGIFDIDMPGMSGPASLAIVKSRFPDLKLIAISALSDAGTISAALAAGCQCYIPKSTGLAEMMTTIREAIVPSGNDLGSWGGRVEDKHHITVRQNDVLKYALSGLTNKEIARELGIAPGTVKVHLATLLKRFGARNRTELLARYHEFGNA